MTDFQWWEEGIVYQIYPRSFQDTTGNGVGDLQGIIDRLDYLNDGTPQSLGVDAIWISPFYPSPMVDFGYDVADYTDVHPLFGDLETFDRLVEAVHARGMKLIVDYVPNHTSDEHPWFVESRSSRDNPKSDWYIWRDAPDDGGLPNNWGTMFGGAAWTWDETREQYYFHQFHPRQPDLNWRNPAVREAMHDVLRFWMERGVDGFRMDVVYVIWKHPDMPDQPFIEESPGRGKNDIFGRQKQIYAFNYDGIHDVMKEIRGVLDEYGAIGIAELWLPMEERMLYYGQNSDEFHLPFNFDLIERIDFGGDNPWTAENVRRLVENYEEQVPADGWPNYVLGNHDVPRLSNRVGEAQTRVAAMLLLTLRGTPTLYMGDEIGMTNGEITEEDMQDPQGFIMGVETSRDVARTPMQWNASKYAGFSEVEPWLPVHSNRDRHNVASQMAQPTSLLALYRRLIWARKKSPALSGGDYESLDSPAGTYVYKRWHDDEVKLVALNFTDEPKQVSLSTGGEVVLDTHLQRVGETVGETLSLAPNEGVIIAQS